MITRENGRIILTCDGCNLTIKDDRFRPYKVAWAQAQEEGWTAKAVDGGKNWKHYCSRCKAPTLGATG